MSRQMTVAMSGQQEGAAEAPVYWAMVREVRQREAAVLGGEGVDHDDDQGPTTKGHPDHIGMAMIALTLHRVHLAALIELIVLVAVGAVVAELAGIRLFFMMWKPSGRSSPRFWPPQGRSRWSE